MKITKITKITKRTVTLAISALLIGCASQPEELGTTYISPIKYNSYDCHQVAMEMDHVSKRTTQLYSSLDKKADDDATQMGIGMILFWPALFFLEGGDGPEAVEYSNLKGEYDALRTASVEKKCSMAYMPKSPQEMIIEKEKKKKALQEQNQDDDFLSYINSPETPAVVKKDTVKTYQPVQASQPAQAYQPVQTSQPAQTYQPVKTTQPTQTNQTEKVALGKWLYVIEKSADSLGCNRQGGAELLSKNGKKEIYSVNCGDKSKMIYQCFYNCELISN